MRQTYPFTAIVGQERMKRALLLNAINPQIGGVLDPRRARHGQIHRRPRPGCPLAAHGSGPGLPL